MKLLFGLAVAILVLATTLEVVNAGVCPFGYDPVPGAKPFCYRSSYDESVKLTYKQAIDTCLRERAWLMDRAFPVLLERGAWWRFDPEYWYDTHPTDICHDIEIHGEHGHQVDEVDCDKKRYYICLKPEVFVCATKDDPIVIGGDGAVSFVVGEGKYRLLEYKNQTNMCEFGVNFRTSESGPSQLLVDEIEINTYDGTKINIDLDHYQVVMDYGTEKISPVGDIPYNASLDGIVFQRDAVLDADGNVTTAGYQLRQTEDGSIVFEVDDCYQSLEAFPRGDHFDATVSLDAVDHSAITGLCGNFDDDPSNDLTTADGQDVSDQPDRYIQMSDSYRIQSP